MAVDPTNPNVPRARYVAHQPGMKGFVNDDPYEQAPDFLSELWPEIKWDDPGKIVAAGAPTAPERTLFVPYAFDEDNLDQDDRRPDFLGDGTEEDKEAAELIERMSHMDLNDKETKKYINSEVSKAVAAYKRSQPGKHKKKKSMAGRGHAGIGDHGLDAFRVNARKTFETYVVMAKQIAVDHDHPTH